MIYKKDIDGKYVIITPQSFPKRFYLSKSEFKNHWEHPISSLYILIAYNDDKFLTFKKQLKNFIEKTETYKKETKGQINFYKTGSNSKTILDLFYSLTKTIQPAEIEQDEAEWITNSKFTVLIYGKLYKRERYYYDVVSMYPSLQKNSKVLFPIKRGCFQLTHLKYLTSKLFISMGFINTK
jgi:hypothetical protein